MLSGLRLAVQGDGLLVAGSDLDLSMRVSAEVRGAEGRPDDEALAAAVGPGEGRWQERLDDDLVLDFGWVEGRFRVRVEGPVAEAGGAKRTSTEALAASFEGRHRP